MRMGRRIPVFPLPGAILFPGLQLPLHIFEQRYRAMVGDALTRDRLIGMVQPAASAVEDVSDPPSLYSVGCIGKIEDVEASEDGRYNIVLTGTSRFRILREIDAKTPFRQVEAEEIAELEEEFLTLGERASFEHEARKYADAQGYAVDWDSVARLDDVTLVNGVSQIAPFDSAAKQALLEAPNLRERCDLLVQLMEFFSRSDPDEDRVTLQ